MITGAGHHRAHEDVEHFFEGMAWLAQIVPFLMLGLLVTPENLAAYLPGAAIGAGPARGDADLSAAVRVQPA